MTKRKTSTAVTIDATPVEHETNHMTEADEPSPFASALDERRFKANLERRATNRETLMEWIRDSLRAGIDYGRIHVVKKEDCPNGKYCPDPSHFSKPSLWKPGAEKICGMLGLNVDFPNLDLYERALIEGRKIEQVMLRCVLVNQHGQIVGKGVGARALAQDSGNLNKTLKMCEKSAHIDATLRAGGLSEVFTQDLDEAGEFEGGPIDPYAPQATDNNAFERTKSINIETHCPIGKGWKGREWSEVDTGFLEWIADNITDKPDINARAKRELAERREADPTAVAPRPHDAGSPKLGHFARRIAMAQTVEEIDGVWQETPTEYHNQLRKAYTADRLKLEAKAKQTLDSNIPM